MALTRSTLKEQKTWPSAFMSFLSAVMCAQRRRNSTFCDAYAQLGARGTSVFFCSGDNGVYSFSFNSTCDATTFGPTFPSGCPLYVTSSRYRLSRTSDLPHYSLTSVGGTQGFSPEVAAPFSGGGFSNIFARPDYQSTAVDGYLDALGSTNAGLFNRSGRAFPDVSAQSVNFITRISGVFIPVEGTSASTPTFASVVALLNDARLNAGQPPLGFINPLLYSQGAAALNDITSGSNPGCGAQGFPTMEGWDPVRASVARAGLVELTPLRSTGDWPRHPGLREAAGSRYGALSLMST